MSNSKSTIRCLLILDDEAVVVNDSVRDSGDRGSAVLEFGFLRHLDWVAPFTKVEK